MSPQALTPPDAGASYAGVYGLAGNHYAAWLIGRGYGELLALTPKEMLASVKPPECTAPRSHADGRTGALVDDKYGLPCGNRMLYRGTHWLCAAHARAVRVIIPPRLQEMPKCPWTPLECIGFEVSLEYRSDSYEDKPSWRWLRLAL